MKLPPVVVRKTSKIASGCVHVHSCARAGINKKNTKAKCGNFVWTEAELSLV